MLPANVGKDGGTGMTVKTIMRIAATREQQVLVDDSPEGLRMTALEQHYDLQQLTAQRQGTLQQCTERHRTSNHCWDYGCSGTSGSEGDTHSVCKFVDSSLHSLARVLVKVNVFALCSHSLQ